MDYRYSIKGRITYNEAETDSGFKTVDIDESVDVDERSCVAALEKFLDDNPQYDFFGTLKTCDVETAGEKGATFRDQNEDQTIDVELIELIEVEDYK